MLRSVRPASSCGARAVSGAVEQWSSGALWGAVEHFGEQWSSGAVEQWSSGAEDHFGEQWS
eukprot:8570297-Pyramimonas_sp.AAC.1